MTLIIAVLLVVLGLAYPALRYALFLGSSARAGTLQYIRSELGGLIWPVTRGALTAGAADLMVVPSYPLGVLGGREPMGKGTPILLIHGLFHNSSAWLVMKRRLREAGYTNLHTYQYNSFTRGFDEAVEGARLRLNAILRNSPDGKVILMGHSLGGLVCRCAVDKDIYRDKVAGIIALGSPHGGSDLAWFGGNRMSRGLIPGREIPTKVSQVADPDCPKLAIYTLVDDFVFPLETLRPNSPGWEERLCSPMGHVWMLYSEEVTGMVIDFLRGTARKH